MKPVAPREILTRALTGFKRKEADAIGLEAGPRREAGPTLSKGRGRCTKKNNNKKQEIKKKPNHKGRTRKCKPWPCAWELAYTPGRENKDEEKMGKR